MSIEEFMEQLQYSHKGYSLKFEAIFSFRGAHCFNAEMYDSDGNNIALITTPNYAEVVPYLEMMLESASQEQGE